ncbi:metal ABC transporter ATP-binding protein [Alicyclobacillus tolerans]|uniref:Zinc/manganese transport system ATP-binding protein n=1 Tax=Alicyclobacillus tolerans TaxID=90970 RepID=A0A1M6PNM3_9BACL|nr:MULTISPECIES: ABC transporter ATP-binding protein [Alicyclobacillus]QRF22301.1 ABC transporter ATP-binding protein [Alicyclobacillus sp. TC]SHK09530.1 zinc/manganese transport system ATP-binding protein [Alicyclobacillus montanus]
MYLRSVANTAPDPVLTVKQVSVRFGSRRVLDNISLELQAGDFVGLIGPNGAGKTTLLKVILGLQPPDAGKVEMEGKVIHRGNSRVGYVPQKISLDPDTPMSARDLVALGLDGHRWGIPLPSRKRWAAVDEALAAVDALRYANAPVGKLSGGEQQRLLIAQALLTQPKLLLLDEPLSNLDIRSAHEVVRLVSRISREQNLAILLVAHDMNPLLGAMDKIVYLAEGRAAMGSVDEVVQSHVLSQLYGYDVEVIRVQGRILVVGGEAPLPVNQSISVWDEALTHVE